VVQNHADARRGHALRDLSQLHVQPPGCKLHRRQHGRGRPAGRVARRPDGVGDQCHGSEQPQHLLQRRPRPRRARRSDVLQQRHGVPALNPLVLDQRTSEYNFYVQDDWRASPNVTFNLGLRYELNTVPYDASGAQVVNDRPLDGSQGPVTFLAAGADTGLSWFKMDKNNFAPSAASPGTRAATQDGRPGELPPGVPAPHHLGAERGRAAPAGDVGRPVPHGAQELVAAGGRPSPPPRRTAVGPRSR